jgi:hypothetical protein
MNIEVATPAGRYRPAAQPAATAAPSADAAAPPADAAPAPASTTPAPAATAATPAAGKSAATAPAMDTDRILKSYEIMTPEQRKQLIKDLEIIDDRDRLATGTNESHKRQKKI